MRLYEFILSDTVLSESYQDEVALQHIASKLADIFMDKDRTVGIIRSASTRDMRLRHFINSKDFGHLYTRLGNYSFTPHYVDSDTSAIGGHHSPSKSPSMRFGSVTIYPEMPKSRMESVIVHELKHALHNSKQAKTDSNFKKNYHIQNKHTKNFDEHRGQYLSKQTEILSRFSEASNFLKHELQKLDATSVTTNVLKQLVYKALEEFSLVHIFKTSKDYVGDEPELTIFGRQTPRSIDTFNPLDNKYFRHLFKKLFEFGTKFIEQSVNKDIAKVK